MVTDEQLAEWERTASEASPGPWEWWTSNSHRRLTGADGRDGGVLQAFVASDGVPCVSVSDADAAFVAAARTAVPELVARVRELEAALREFKEAADRAGPDDYVEVPGSVFEALGIERPVYVPGPRQPPITLSSLPNSDPLPGFESVPGFASKVRRLR